MNLCLSLYSEREWAVSGCEIRIIIQVINTQAGVLNIYGNSTNSTRTNANACNEYFFSVF